MRDIMACIYKIYFAQCPEKLYIGSAINFNLRKIRHKHQLKKSIHKNIYLQRLYNKYGRENLSFEIIEKIDNPTFLIQREQFFINLLKPQINILKIAGSALGYRHTEETKKHISKINLGRKMTQEQIQKGVIARIGQRTSLGCKRTEEMKKRLSEIKKKRVINNISGKIYVGVQEAADYIGIKYQTLYAKLSGRNTNNTELRFL